MQFPSAAIDLGTNTSRLLIGYAEAGRTIKPVLYMRRITRLGGGFTKEGGISAEAGERTVAALRDFAAEIRRHRIARIRAVATSAVRDAVNRIEFCAHILNESGIEIEIIDGETEGTMIRANTIRSAQLTFGRFLAPGAHGSSVVNKTEPSSRLARFFRSSSANSA